MKKNKMISAVEGSCQNVALNAQNAEKHVYLHVLFVTSIANGNLNVEHNL